jgi:hypothetical protein
MPQGDQTGKSDQELNAQGAHGRVPYHGADAHIVFGQEHRNADEGDGQKQDHLDFNEPGLPPTLIFRVVLMVITAWQPN